jgi:hypothetical protein
MTRHLSIVTALTLALCTLFTLANEPGWTDAQRADHSDAVVVGRVVSVKRVEEVNEREDLYRAVVKLEGVTKGHAAVGRHDEELALYFLRPKAGPADARCPQYVSLAADQRASFYVRFSKIGVEVRALLEMFSDVRDPPEVR